MKTVDIHAWVALSALASLTFIYFVAGGVVTWFVASSVIAALVYRALIEKRSRAAGMDAASAVPNTRVVKNAGCRNWSA
jgi:hypothetical protein